MYTIEEAEVKTEEKQMEKDQKNREGLSIWGAQGMIDREGISLQPMKCVEHALTYGSQMVAVGMSYCQQWEIKRKISTPSAFVFLVPLFSHSFPTPVHCVWKSKTFPFCGYFSCQRIPSSFPPCFQSCLRLCFLLLFALFPRLFICSSFCRLAPGMPYDRLTIILSLLQNACCIDLNCKSELDWGNIAPSSIHFNSKKLYWHGKQTGTLPKQVKDETKRECLSLALRVSLSLPLCLDPSLSVNPIQNSFIGMGNKHVHCQAVLTNEK